MSTFGAVIPVTGLNFGFVGQVSRTGGGDPFIVSKQANNANINNISFGDVVVAIPDSLGGTYRQFADYIANGGGTSVAVTLATSTTVTVTAAAMAGLAPGQFIFGANIPAGTFIVSVNQAAGTITISKAATASGASTIFPANFAGIAVREVKTQLTYPITPGASLVGNYLPGQLTEVLVRGSITVKILNGTPIQGGSLYVRAILNGTFPNGIVGGLEAMADGVNNILIPNATFKTGVLDGNNITEVTLLTRVAA